MDKRKKDKDADLGFGGEGQLETFGTGEVARFLKVDIWRIQKYLNSPKYQLSSSGHLGIGRGSRRVFTDTDIYRLGLAEHLVSNGFSYKFVASALQQINDDDFFGPISHEGIEQDLIYALVGGNENVQVSRIGRDKKIKEMMNRIKKPSFYLLDLSAVVREIYKRIQEGKKNNVNL